jgi:hypothetical protein
MAMDSILQKMELRGNISTRLKQCTAYADDILITTKTTQAMFDTFVNLKNQSLKYGLIVNVHKTKYLKCTRRQDQPKPINIENNEFEQVKSFKYLGSMLIHYEIKPFSQIKRHFKVSLYLKWQS